jgi:hypothetical protein
MNVELDLIPVSQLSERYGVARSNIYNRLAGLQIEPEKQGNKSYINADQLALMDALDLHLKAGGAIADFHSDTPLSYRPTGQLQPSYRTQNQSEHQGLVIRNQESAIALAGLVDAIASKLRDLKSHDPLENLRTIAEACDRGWQLSTSQLAPLLGLKVLSGKEIKRYGYTFTCVGRNGVESAWKITKE